jgi:hypothetical protein
MKIMKDKFKQCCELMQQFLEDENIPLKYYPIMREYSMDLYHSFAVQGIDYCPWCGTKLPMSVRDKYFDILEKEYEINDRHDPEQEKRIPAEFKSDVWWKKRNL